MYEQIAAVLRREILQKKYGDRGCIGTHAELTQRFGVSMITVRKAVQLLHEEKLVDIKQGKGTFVRSTLLHDNLSCLTGASNIMQASKLPALVSVPVFETIDTPRHLDADLRAGLGRRCLHITRIHSVDGTPLSYAELYLPACTAAALQKTTSNALPYTRFIRTSCGFRWASAVRASGPRAPGAKPPARWTSSWIPPSLKSSGAPIPPTGSSSNTC